MCRNIHTYIHIGFFGIQWDSVLLKSKKENVHTRGNGWKAIVVTVFLGGSMERSFGSFRKKHLSFWYSGKAAWKPVAQPHSQKFFQRGENKLTSSVDVVYPKSWDYRLCVKELTSNFHLWGKVRNNVKKLFLTVFFKITFKRKATGIFMSECTKSRKDRTALYRKKGHTQMKVIWRKSNKRDPLQQCGQALGKPQGESSTLGC